MRNMSEWWIEWVEPFGPNFEPIYLRTLASTAVMVQKKAAAFHGHTYENDKRALEDFMIINWASAVRIK